MFDFMSVLGPIFVLFVYLAPIALLFHLLWRLVRALERIAERMKQ